MSIVPLSSPVTLFEREGGGDVATGAPPWTVAVGATLRVEVDIDAVRIGDAPIASTGHDLFVHWYDADERQRAVIPLDLEIIPALREALDTAEADLTQRSGSRGLS